MDIFRIKLLIVSILCSGFCRVESATINTVITPNPALKGNTSQHEIKCEFTLEASETFRSVTLSLPSSSEPLIATLYDRGGPEWPSAVPNNLRDRGGLSGSMGSGELLLTVNDTRCEDKDLQYRCQITYSLGSTNNVESTATMQVEAEPEAPSMTVDPNSQNATEYTNMTFVCDGNVGLPAGSFQWFTYIGSTSQNVTDQVTQDVPVLSGDGCTFNGRSQLTLNLTRTEPNQPLVVRCRVNAKHGNSDPTACNNPDEDYCRMSQEISVEYPVSVRVASDTVTIDEGSEYSITCNTEGNPPPHQIEWRREGQGSPIANEKRLTLSGVTMGDSGNYICTAYNTVGGIVKNDSIVVTVNVAETTTPEPTTTTESTTPTTKGSGATSPNTAGGGDETTIIIVVVVVVVFVIIVVVIILVFFIRRRRQAKEPSGPPEKTFSNPAPVKPKPTQPDVVNNFNNMNGYKNEDGLGYAELQFDNKPRSRRPLALDDSRTDYSDVSMPQV